MNVKELVFRKGKKLKLVVVGVWRVVRKTQRLPNSGILLFWLTKGLYLSSSSIVIDYFRAMTKKFSGYCEH